MLRLMNMHRQVTKQGLVPDRVNVYQLSYVNKSLVLQETWAMSLSVLKIMDNFLNVTELRDELMEEGVSDKMNSLITGGKLDPEMTYQVKKLRYNTLRNTAMKETAGLGVTKAYPVETRSDSSQQSTILSSTSSSSPSASSSSPSASNCCSNCKKPRTNELKLQKCGACKQVQYCGKYVVACHLLLFLVNVFIKPSFLSSSLQESAN